MRAAPGTEEAAVPKISYTGIGDEAGAGLPDQVKAISLLGWSSIELRTVDGIAIGYLDEPAFARLADTLAAEELTVTCVASQIGNWARPITADFMLDLHELDVLARRCAALGTRYVKVMSYPNAGLNEREWEDRVLRRMRVLARRADDAGVVLLHENCAGWAGSHADRMLALLNAVDSPALRLLFDTGNGIAYGYEAYDVLARVIDYVVHVHVKDADGDAANPSYTLPGTGRARVADCLRLLVGSGYTGAWSIEPHLALRPHKAARHQRVADVVSGQDRWGGFVASGHALQRLVREQVLPAFPAWQVVPGGLAQRSGG